MVKLNDTTVNCMLERILEPYIFTAEEYIEDNGSVTLFSVDLDLVENGKDKEEAINKLAAGILDFSEDFYNDFDLWARGSRIAQIPYVLKALMLNDIDKIGSLIICRLGES